jgi:hypothetical protein
VDGANIRAFPAEDWLLRGYGAEEEGEAEGEIKMDQAKVDRAAYFLLSVLSREILAPIENFELNDMGHDHYRLSFKMNGAEKVFPMTAAYVEGIATGNEAIWEQVKNALFELARQ